MSTACAQVAELHSQAKGWRPCPALSWLNLINCNSVASDSSLHTIHTIHSPIRLFASISTSALWRLLAVTSAVAVPHAHECIQNPRHWNMVCGIDSRVPSRLMPALAAFTPPRLIVNFVPGLGHGAATVSTRRRAGRRMEEVGTPTLRQDEAILDLRGNDRRDDPGAAR